MKWDQIKRFNFTYALPDGAWLEDATGYRNWEPFSVIAKYKGSGWFYEQIKRQGMFTGCWIDVA